MVNLSRVILKFLAYFSVIVVVIAGCGLRPHKIDINQGNLLDQSAIEQLAVGMTKEQVEFLIGSPILQEHFNKQRWDYIYLLQPGRGDHQRRLISLYFEGDTVAKIEGDLEAPPETEK